MIFTLTVNPSIDYHMKLEDGGLIPGSICRSDGECIYPGGKGLNVSVVLTRLGIRNRAWGFTAGRTGALLEELCRDYDCTCDFLRLPEGLTRINVKLDGETESAINGKGPSLDPESVSVLMERISGLDRADTLVISGAAPDSAGDLFTWIGTAASKKGVRLVVDAFGHTLRELMAFSPYLIKPNLEELAGLFPDEDVRYPIRLMYHCQEQGAKNVLLSCGRVGSVLLTDKGKLYRCTVKNLVPAKSTVGAGDSMLAGYLAGLAAYGGDSEKALALAGAAGTACAYNSWLPSREEIMEQVGNMEIRPISRV